MTPATTTRAPSPRPARSMLHEVRLLHALGAVGAVVLAVFLSHLLAAPHFIPRITLDNPTPYDLTVDVAGADRDGWMPIGTATRSTGTVSEEIYDIGSTWIFRFAGQGEDGGEVRMTRAELEQSKWHVPIPAAVGEQLRARGAPTPAAGGG